MMKLSMKYGLLVGLGSFAWLLAEYFLGYRTTKFDIHLTTSLFAVIILIVGIVLAVAARRAQQGKAFRFKDGLITGLGVSLVAGIIMVAGQYVYLGVIDKGYANRAKAWSTYILVLDGDSLETAKAKTADGAWKQNIHAKALSQIPLFLVQGAIISTVVSAVTIRRRKV